jgi:hypothetical protein
MLKGGGDVDLGTEHLLPAYDQRGYTTRVHPDLLPCVSVCLCAFLCTHTYVRECVCVCVCASFDFLPSCLKDDKDGGIIAGFCVCVCVCVCV